eukprot:403336037
MEISVNEVFNKSNVNRLGLGQQNDNSKSRLGDIEERNASGLTHYSQEVLEEMRLQKQQQMARGIIRLEMIAKKIKMRKCKQNAFNNFHHNVVNFKNAQQAVQKEIEEIKEQKKKKRRQRKSSKKVIEETFSEDQEEDEFNDDQDNDINILSQLDQYLDNSKFDLRLNTFQSRLNFKLKITKQFVHKQSTLKPNLYWKQSQ